MNYLLKRNSSTASLASKCVHKLMSKTGLTLSLVSAALFTLSGCGQRKVSPRSNVRKATGKKSAMLMAYKGVQVLISVITLIAAQR